MSLVAGEFSVDFPEGWEVTAEGERLEVISPMRAAIELSVFGISGSENVEPMAQAAALLYQQAQESVRRAAHEFSRSDPSQNRITLPSGLGCDVSFVSDGGRILAQALIFGPSSLVLITQIADAASANRATDFTTALNAVSLSG